MAFVTAESVRSRLDAVAPGQWTASLRPLPAMDVADPERKGEITPAFACLCQLVITGVSRDGIGEGRSPKAAATDSLKRAAQMFGIGHELREVNSRPLWVPMSDGGQYARPTKEPRQVYIERVAREGSGAGDRGRRSRRPDRGPGASCFELACYGASVIGVARFA